MLSRVTSSFNLYIFRLLYCIVLACAVSGRAFDYWETRHSGFFKGLIISFPFNNQHLTTIEFSLFTSLLIVSILLLGLGLKPHLSGSVALLSYLNIFLPIHWDFKPYDDNLVPFNILILLLIPLGSIFNMSKQQIHEKAPAWPIELFKLNLALVYFSAFTSKMINTGLSWGDGTHLQNYILERFLLTGSPVPLWVAQHYFICVCFSVFTLLAESTFWTVLIPSRMNKIVVLAGVGLHIGIYIVMLINFQLFVISYLCFVPYDKVYLKLRSLWLLKGTV